MNRTVKIQKAPFLRNSDTVSSLMGDMLIIMPFLYVMPLCFYGFRIIKNLIISLLVCYFSDIICAYLKNKNADFKDISSLVTGAIIPLLFPVSIDFFTIVCTGLFAVFIAKHPFGGLGNNPFNPAAAAFCFAAVSWPEKVFYYTKPLTRLNIFGTVTDKSAETVAQSLAKGGKPNFEILDILCGNVAGAAGCVSVIVMLAAAGYLIYKHSITFQIPVGIFITVAVFSLIFPRITTGRLESVWYELNCGALVFCSLFMATEPVTSPKHPKAKWIYGVCIGIIIMLFRYYGKMEIAEPFAVIIANSFTPFLDKIGTGIDRYTDLTPAMIVKKEVGRWKK